MLRLLGLASIGVAVALVRVGYSSFFRASRVPPEASVSAGKGDGDDDPRLLAAAVASAAVAAAVAAGNSLAPSAAATATPPERPLEHDGAGVKAPSPAPGTQRVASAFEALRDPFDQSLSPDRRAVFLGGAGDDAYGGLAPSPYAAAASPPRSPVSGPAPFAGLASPSAADLGLPMLSIPRPTAKALEPSPDSEPDSAAASSPAFSEALEREASGYAADAGSGPGSEDLGAGGAMEGPHPPPFPGLRLSLPGDAPAGPLSLTPGASGEGFDFMPSEDDQFALELSRVLEDDEELWETFRVSMDVEAVLALKLDVLAGPCRDASYVTEDDTLEVTVGRTPGNSLALRDGEVSGRHLAVTWSSLDRCWQAADLGSLNGTLLNGEPISVGARQRGPDYRLSSDDILQLGSYTKIKVSTFPRDLLNPKDTHGSLPVGSLPKSLSMPKHRVMSFGSLTSPKPTANTPSRQPAATTACDELRMEACVLCRVGREHTRKGQPGEDVACAQCPLPDPGRLGEASVSLFCVFDGHCGRGAAEAAAVALPEEIGVRLPACEADMLEQRGAVSALRPAFLATDARIRAEEGCTATAVLAWSPRKGIVCLQAGNVGDSTALWIDPRTVEVVELTEDHRLSNERERRRLADMGIQLSKNSRRLYGLNLSRGLGDKFLKDEDLGLSAEPYVGPVVTCSASEGGLLLIASDGLWDVADFATVARVLCQSLRASGGDLVDGARAVLAHALKHRTKDDVSIVLARVLPEAEWEARSPPRSFSSGPIFGDP
ncbi:Protein phosphatase 2C 70 [Auxenochlorella protothecoides]|uniref:Protein phosphatase 2C 70 n=1 Tax=Auxenochlorella protothecoides TaxID=3075 RepID=A0A087SDX8_AUXPR|nr:Protein phosphatase 2C 70 [Auxenochlorella protothecoides]KFM23932.1 Protein phosphatase 2C 70 [Auxenochlorella protothecoides]